MEKVASTIATILESANLNRSKPGAYTILFRRDFDKEMTSSEGSYNDGHRAGGF